jgi:DNA-binding NtrC family response regulator
MNEDSLKFRILIVDDEKNVRRSVAVTLEDAGYLTHMSENAMGAMQLLRSERFDLALIDIRMGEISGIQLLKNAKEEGISVPMIFMSGNASLTEAVEAIRLGACDFLEKPFSPERLLVGIEKALKLGKLERELTLLRIQKNNGKRSLDMIGQSMAMRRLLSDVDRIGPTKSKVLILGESGTGKELIARAIHGCSQVAKGPFMKVNCAAIPDELIESELFGHERGSFTGATQMKRGLFELAHNGTLFLDEIAEMSASAQAKVLRVLQNQEFTRVGGSQVIRVQVRIIAATHRDLAQAVQESKFREDLYFRLNVVPIRAIPLREKTDDIPLLIQSFLKEFCAENGFSDKEVATDAMSALLAYPWPGNVRELRNVIERLSIFAGDRIELADLPMEIRNPAHVSGNTVPLMHANSERPLESLESFKKRAERDYILAVLKRTQGNITKAALILDTERTYLHRKLNEHKISKSEYF